MDDSTTAMVWANGNLIMENGHLNDITIRATHMLFFVSNNRYLYELARWYLNITIQLYARKLGCNSYMNVA